MTESHPDIAAIRLRMHEGHKKAAEHVSAAIFALIKAGASNQHRALWLLETVEQLLRGAIAQDEGRI